MNLYFLTKSPKAEMTGDLQGPTHMDNTNLDDHYAANGGKIEKSVDCRPNKSEENPELSQTPLSEVLKPLYPGCTNFSRTEFLLKLLHLRVINGWNTEEFDMLLQLIKEAMPSGETLPNTYVEAMTLVYDIEVLLSEALQPLYPGRTKFSKMEFLMKLFHLKITNRLSTEAFNMNLNLIKAALPPGETLPNSYDEAVTFMRNLGLDDISTQADELIIQLEVQLQKVRELYTAESKAEYYRRCRFESLLE